MIIKRTLTRDMPDRSRVVVELELRIAEEGEQLVNGISPGFSATCEVYEPHGTWSGAAQQANGREPDTFGAAHDLIVRAFPKLKPLIDIHLSDPDGTPMHAEANAWYFYCGSRADLQRSRETSPGWYRLPIHGWTPGLGDDWRIREAGFGDDWRAYAYHLACKTLRVDEIKLDPDGWRGGYWPFAVRAQFTEFVAAQRERWAREAAEAQAFIEQLPTGREQRT